MRVSNNFHHRVLIGHCKKNHIALDLDDTTMNANITRDNNIEEIEGIDT